MMRHIDRPSPVGLKYTEGMFFENGLFNIPVHLMNDFSDWFLIIIHQMTNCHAIAFGTEEMLKAFDYHSAVTRNDYQYSGLHIEKLCRLSRAEVPLLQRILFPSPIMARRYAYDEDSFIHIILLLEDRLSGYDASKSGFSYQIEQLKTDLATKSETSRNRARQNKRLKQKLRELEQQISLLRVENAELRIATPVKSRAGYVYLLEGANGNYKIGRSKNPDNRIKTFNVKLPFEVEYLHLIQTEDMYTLESELHSRFSTKHVNGEWFALSQADIDYIKSL